MLMNRLDAGDPQATDENVERAVANAVMMVGVQPKEQSNRFSSGESVRVVGEKQNAVHLGPGTNFPVLELINEFTQGEILAHKMNGILAKGNYWWLVKFGEVQGWMEEIRLEHLYNNGS